MYYYIEENGSINTEIYPNTPQTIKVLKTDYNTFVDNIPFVDGKRGVAVADIANNKLAVKYIDIAPTPIEPTDGYIPYTNEELAYMQHNQIRAQNRQISGEIGATKVKEYRQLDESELLVYQKDLHMYTKGYKNKDFSAVTVYQAVEMGEIYPTDYTDITGFDYVAPVIVVQPTNEELKEMQLITLQAQAEMFEEQNNNALIQFEVLAEIYEKMGV